MQTLLTLAAQTAEQAKNYRLGYASDANFPARVLAM